MNPLHGGWPRSALRHLNVVGSHERLGAWDPEKVPVTGSGAGASPALFCWVRGVLCWKIIGKPWDNDDKWPFILSFPRKKKKHVIFLSYVKLPEDTLRQSNATMEHEPFIRDFPVKTSIHRGIFHCHVWLPEGNNYWETWQWINSFQLVTLLGNMLPIKPHIRLGRVPFLDWIMG